MEFETVERSGHIHVVKNSVESECFAVTSYGDHQLVYCPALQAQTASLEEALRFIASGMDTWYTAAEAAERLVETGVFDKVSAHDICLWARNGLLSGSVKIPAPGQGGAWRIPESALEALAQRRGQ